MSGLKSEFGLKKVKLLGKTISQGNIYPGASKVQGLTELRRPRTVSDVRSVYGLLSHFRQFVKDFAKKCKPITQLLSKVDGNVTWG